MDGDKAADRQREIETEMRDGDRKHFGGHENRNHRMLQTTCANYTSTTSAEVICVSFTSLAVFRSNRVIVCVWTVCGEIREQSLDEQASISF